MNIIENLLKNNFRKNLITLTLVLLFLSISYSLIIGRAHISLIIPFVPLSLFILSNLILYFVGFFCGYLFRKYLFHGYKKITRENDDNNKFAAILISNSVSDKSEFNWWQRTWKNFLTNINICSVYFLCRSLEVRKCNYCIVEKILKEDLDNVIKDEKYQEIYIFGHGSKGSLITSDEIICYSKYAKCGKTKQIVSQFHCNHSKYEKDNLSLTEILALDEKNSYLTNGYGTFPEHLCYCIKLLLYAIAIKSLKIKLS
jgi:hypothetical protein